MTTNLYNEILAKIFSAYPMYHKIGSSAYKEGLENIETLAELAGHPEKKFKSIHIAGTNGKGSTAHLFASFFQELGLKTGLYTSPHLVDFTERIKINGQPIPKEYVIQFFQKNNCKFANLDPSFFEIITTLAFDYFASEKVDIAIIEAGLGGRLDCTNIILPLLSVITNISMDHTALLGNDIRKIAKEKAGIIKHRIPIVVGETQEETAMMFTQLAKSMKSSIVFADEKYTVEFSDNETTIYKKKKIRKKIEQEIVLQGIHCPLNSNYQTKNIATFLAGIDVLKDQYSFTSAHIQSGLQNVITNTSLLGRWQIIKNCPLTICDVGHNYGAFQYITEQIKKLKIKNIHFVFGMANDKDIAKILSILPKKNTIYYLCSADINRAMDTNSLHSLFSDNDFATKVCGTVANAYKQACIAAQNDDLIFIGGSCFVVGDFLKYLTESTANK